MGEPQNWTAAYFSPEMGKYRHDELFDCGALLLGRVTYDSFADVWPARPGLDTVEQAYADRLNSMPKYVVSQSLSTAEWENTTVINNDVEAAIATLKAEDGQDILIHGSATLVNYLLNAGLIDTIRLVVFPVVVGDELRLFAQGATAELRLVSSQTFPRDVVIMEYEPVNS